MPERARRRQRLRLAVALAGLCLCGLCTVTAVGAYASAVAWVRHTLDVDRKASAWLVTLRDADGFARAYILSGQREQLDDMERAIAEQRRDADEMRRLTADNPVQQENIERAAQRAAEVVAKMREATSAEPRRDGAILTFETGDEKTSLGAFRAAIERVRSEEERLLALRENDLRARRGLSLAGLGLFLVVTAWIAVAAWKARTQAETATGLAEAQRALADQRADAMRFQDTFVAILGHDLRNPLNAISMALQLIERRSGLTGEAAVPVGRMKTAAARMRRMIDQILDYARVRLGRGIPVEPREVDLAQLADQIVAEVRLAHPDRVIEWDRNGPMVDRCDPDRIAQVVSNLVGNAVAHGSEMPVTVALGAEAGRVSVSVTNGGEIPEDVRALVFDPFRRGDPRQATRGSGTEGLGLGLYIAKHVVEAHAGTLTFACEDGKTTFTMSLPKQASR